MRGSFRSFRAGGTDRLEKTDEPGCIDAQSLEHVLDSLIDRGSLPRKRVRNGFRVQIVEVPQERTRSHRRDRIRIQSCSREVLHVESHDDFRITTDCGRQDMSILGIVCHGRDETLVAFNPRFWEVSSNFTLPVSDLLLGQPEVLGEVPVHFGHDLVGPLWEVEPSSARKTQQGVGQRHRDENAGVQDDLEICSHPTLSLIIATLWHHIAVIQTSFKCLPGEPVESRLAFFVTLVGEFKDVS